MFKALSLFALALLLVAAVAAPIDLSNVPSAAGSTADSLETNELLSKTKTLLNTDQKIQTTMTTAF